MTKPFIFSVSSVKTFCSSKAKWAGKYILKIQEDTDFWDSLSIGKLFEHRLMTGEDKYELCENVKNMEDIVTAYDTLKWNSEWMVFERGEWNKEVKWEVLWVPFVWYIDNFTKDCIYDIKTSQYLSKEDSKQINHRSWMTYYQEYELQLWVYHMLTGINKCRILEVSKHKYVTAKDKDRHEHQIIEFNFDKAYDENMSAKYWPIVNEMKEMLTKFAK